MLDTLEPQHNVFSLLPFSLVFLVFVSESTLTIRLAMAAIADDAAGNQEDGEEGDGDEAPEDAEA